MAQEAVAEGVARVDKQLARTQAAGPAQVALVAVDPRTGEILALVGGRAYNAVAVQPRGRDARQPGSVFKPFVYLAAFERMAEEGRGDLTPATVVVDEPTIFKDGDKDYAPGNYQNEYDGPITLRRALALSRNIVTIKVAETDRLRSASPTSGRRSASARRPSRIRRSRSACSKRRRSKSPTAYTLFTNDGIGAAAAGRSRASSTSGKTRRSMPPRRRGSRAAGDDVSRHEHDAQRHQRRHGRGARCAAASRSTPPARPARPTTCATRGSSGFTPELLTVVWVGFDDNQPIGLSGSQAALPIWTTFMRRALAGATERRVRRARPASSSPTIDKDTGELATPDCPRTFNEAFLAGTEPHEYCDLHGGARRSSKLGSFFRRIIR